MQSAQRPGLKCLFYPTRCYCILQTRKISLTGAIERGIRKQQKVTGRQVDDPKDNERSPKIDNASGPLLGRWPTLSKNVIRPSSVLRAEQESSLQAPDSVPFTKANSEFLYGTFAVQAALTARRRQLHTLYVYVQEADNGYLRSEIETAAARIENLMVKRVSGARWLFLLNKICQGRPHNGFVLEASPLPTSRIVGGLKVPEKRPSTSISTSTTQDFTFQEAEPTSSEAQSFPFCLFLDQILDPGNLGAIIRSAYYFGVDRVILPEHNTAPLSGVAIKASAGAAEYLPISLVKDEVDFIRQSKAQGWHFYGAVPAQSYRSQGNARLVSSALSQHPTVLVLGSEAEGIRPRIARHLDETISIATVALHPGIDSLNVSVAASILMRDFLLERNRQELQSRS